MIQTSGIVDGIMIGLGLVFAYWWILLPVILGVVAYGAWADYQRAKHLASLKWVVIEVVPPPDVPFSTAKAAENIFSGLHATYGGGTGWKSQFFGGKVPPAFSFEIISDGGETHFMIRCLEDQRNFVEGLIFAQYPEAEIKVIPDYVNLLPDKLDLSQYDVSGAELEFAKDQAYPIKTYLEFEEAGGKDEYSRLDPIAPLVEIMSALRPGEHLWLQYIFRATGGDWAKENQKVVDKIKGKKEEVKEPWFVHLILLPFHLIGGALSLVAGGEAEAPKKEEKKEEFNLGKLTVSEKNVLEKVEYKLAKLAFKTGIRLLYTAQKDSFNGSRIASVTGMFKQLYYTNLNSFKPANGTRDKGKLPWMFPSDKGFGADEGTAKKKMKMYAAYRNRTFPRKGPKEVLCILTTEELATIWHLPAINVRAPMLPRVTAKKGQPPAILPTRT